MKTYDCTSGSAQHCYGCYTMEVDKAGYGDWVNKEELVERLEAIRVVGVDTALTGIDTLIEELSK